MQAHGGPDESIQRLMTQMNTSTSAAGQLALAFEHLQYLDRLARMHDCLARASELATHDPSTLLPEGGWSIFRGAPSPATTAIVPV